MKSKELCEYLERLRSARNISQEAFTSGIVSLRQYRRYLNGESDIPFQTVDQLSEKLGVQTINLLKEIETARIEETKEIDTFYNAVVNYSNDLVTKSIQVWKDREFVDPENKLLYEHGVVLYEFYIGNISVDTMVKTNKELIRYPKILKQSIFTEVEMLILSSLLDNNENAKENALIYENLNNYLTNRFSIMTAGFSFGLNLVLYRLARYSGKTREFKDVITYCNLGIERNLSQRIFYLMDYFYYFNALAYYRLGDMESYEKSIIACFHVLQFEGNEKKIEKFTKLINQDFNIDFESFVMKHYEHISC